MTTLKPKDKKQKSKLGAQKRFADARSSAKSDSAGERPRANHRQNDRHRQNHRQIDHQDLRASATPKSCQPSLAYPSPQIVSETEHYVIVDKPALLDSQNSRSDRGSVVEWLNKKYGYSGLVHRLDFGTSGLMVCAKNSEAAARLTSEMQSGAIKRTYQAIILGNNLPDQGKFESALDGQSAVTSFKTLERFANACLVEVHLETGRKHQIRKHFSEANHPLLGDQLYKKRGSERLFGRPALHASKLMVLGKEYSSPLPADFQALLSRLRKATRS